MASYISDSQSMENDEEISMQASYKCSYSTAENVLEEEREIIDDSRRKKGKSLMWSHFSKRQLDGVVKAECNYCLKLFAARKTSGTTHLRTHFTSCAGRKDCIKEEKKPKKYVTNIFNQEDSTRELAHAIIMHEYPLSMVDHIGFRRFSNSLQPLFKIPSRDTIKNEVMKVYDHEREKTMRLLEALDSRVAITTNMWTSNTQKKGFMAITAHFVDNKWILQSRIIRFAYVPIPHTKDVLAKVLIESLMDWNLDTRLSTVTVDNCSANDALMVVVKEKLQASHLILNGELIHMRCCAHILNLIAKDGLEVIKAGVEKVRESVLYWTASLEREEKFEETCRHLCVPITEKLGLDCPTRWNSTCLMLKTALMYKDVFIRLEQHDSQYKCFPSESEWDFARIVCDRMRLFHDITKLFSGRKYPTTNWYFPKVCEIRLKLLEWHACPIPIVSEMASEMLKIFDKYWDAFHCIMGVAAVLDPRYKMTLIEFYLPKVYRNEHVKQLENIRSLCYRLVEFYASNRCGNNLNSSSNDQLNNVSAISTSGLLAEFDNYVRQMKRIKVLHRETELDRYLEEDVLPRRDDFDILSWWEVQGDKYPILQSIAKDLLAVPLSTVASESVFSTSGKLVSPHRSRPLPKTLEVLMCAQNWLWAIENEDEEALVSDNYATIDNNDEGSFLNEMNAK